MKVAEIDDSAPLPENILTLKDISILTKMANESSEIALNLLNANKETVKELNKPKDLPAPKRIELVAMDDSGSSAH